MNSWKARHVSVFLRKNRRRVHWQSKKGGAFTSKVVSQEWKPHVDTIPRNLLRIRCRKITWWAQVLTVMVNAQVRSSHFRLVTAFSAWNVWKSVPRITRNDSAFSMTCTGVSTLSLTWCHVSYVYHRALNGALHNYRYHWRNTVQDPTTWNGYGFVKNSTIKKEILKMKSFCSFSTIKRKLKGKNNPK